MYCDRVIFSPQYDTNFFVKNRNALEKLETLWTWSAREFDSKLFILSFAEDKVLAYYMDVVYYTK